MNILSDGILRLIEVGILLSSWISLFTILERRISGRQHQERPDKDGTPSNQNADDSQDVGDPPVKPTQKHNSYPSEGEHRATEQSFWWWQSVLGIGALFLSAVAVCIAVRAYLINIDALIEAAKATEQARRQADAAQDATRAWLRVTRADSGGIIVFPDRMTVYITPVVKNVGHTPADVIRVDGLAYVSIDPRHIQSTAQSICQRAAGVSGTFLASVFPDEEVSTSVRQDDVSRVDIEAAKADRINFFFPAAEFMSGAMKRQRAEMVAQPVMAEITLIGCITYTYLDGQKRGQTPFVLDVRKPCPRLPDTACGIDINQFIIYQPEEIELILRHVGLPAS